MQVLEKSAWEKTLKNIITEELPFVVICMHYQKGKSGSIWVDSIKNPRTVVARFQEDAFLYGDLSKYDLQNFLEGFKGEIAGNADLEKILNSNNFKYEKIPSIKYKYRENSWSPKFPNGYIFEKIQKTDLLAIKKIWKSDYIGSYDSEEELLMNNFGVMAIAQGECVAVCDAMCVSEKRYDLRVGTLKEYRGRGLATVCAYLTIQEGLRRNKEPVWVTEIKNEASQKIAQKLGFQKEYEFFIYRIG